MEQTEAGPRLPHCSITHCCTANAARTLYFVWDAMVTREPDEVRVNLLLNRASPWLDVDSYLPVEGRVLLHIKDAPNVAVRIPEWCGPGDVRVTVNGEDRRPVVQGRYVRVGRLRPGDEVALALPLREQIVHRVIGEIPYKLTLRGSSVVAIDPPGIGYPLYKDQPTGALVRGTRFVPAIRGIVW